MEVATEKEIERINIVDGKKEFSVKGVKGLKLSCYATGGKIFEFKYQLEGCSYTAKTLGEWVKAVYGIKQAGDDVIEILRKIKSGETYPEI